LDVSDAPFSLHYGSERVPGHTATRTLDTPLSGSVLPGSVQRIELGISVAGRTFTKRFSPAPNQHYRFTWDGKDAYGRTVTGQQNVRYAVGYVYPLVYQER
jgi:hypothetical protein